MNRRAPRATGSELSQQPVSSPARSAYPFSLIRTPAVPAHRAAIVLMACQVDDGMLIPSAAKAAAIAAQVDGSFSRARMAIAEGAFRG